MFRYIFFQKLSAITTFNFMVTMFHEMYKKGMGAPEPLCEPLGGTPRARPVPCVAITPMQCKDDAFKQSKTLPENGNETQTERRALGTLVLQRFPLHLLLLGSPTSTHMKAGNISGMQAISWSRSTPWQLLTQIQLLKSPQMPPLLH